MKGTISGCGDYSFSYIPGARLGATNGYAECGSAPDSATGSTGTLFGFGAVSEGKTITFRMPLKDLPGKVRAGDEFLLINAETDLVEPVFGLVGVGTVGPPFYDSAKTTAEYVVG